MRRRTFVTGCLAAGVVRGETPQSLAGRLSQVYGREVSDVVYTQTIAMVGRVKLGQTEDVTRLLAPWLNGERDSLAKATASHYSGHLVFGHLDHPRARKLLIAAADRAMESPLDNEMSDSIFMVCPLLARAGKLSGEKWYWDRAVQHFQRMENLCRRPGGLYRHSPLGDVAWGRGNAFPLLGLAWTLSEMDSSHAGFGGLRDSCRNLAGILARYQDTSGMWRQVIDHPESWLEFSATAMIAMALRRGVRRGWLEAREYDSRIEKAWAAIQPRIDGEGNVSGVCESTGKLPTLADYLRRKALQGKDARGGGMALLLAVEMSA